MRMSPEGSRARIASPAETPAGPFPMMTYLGGTPARSLILARLKHVTRFHAQRAAKAARHALAARQAMGIGDGEALASVAPHVDPERAIEGTDAAFDATGRLGDDVRLDHRLAASGILLQEVS